MGFTIYQEHINSSRKWRTKDREEGYMNLNEDSPKELDLWDSLWCPKENLDLECFLDRRDRHSLIPQQALKLNSKGLEVVMLGRVVGFEVRRPLGFLISHVSTVDGFI